MQISTYCRERSKWPRFVDIRMQWKRGWVPDTHNFRFVLNFTVMSLDSSEQIFAIFIFVEWMSEALATPLPVDGHVPHMNRRNNTEQGRKEASLCNNGRVFLLYGGLRNYKSIRTATVGEKLACWTERFTLLISTSKRLLRFIGICIVAGWFFSTATI